MTRIREEEEEVEYEHGDLLLHASNSERKFGRHWLQWRQSAGHWSGQQSLSLTYRGADGWGTHQVSSVDEEADW